MSAQTEALLDIDQVTQVTGLPQATLRNWEKRYGFPNPQRTAGGHRLYSIHEVRKIQAVVAIYRKGATAPKAIAQVLEGTPPAAEVTEIPSSIISESILQVANALYRFDHQLAEETISRVGMRLSEKDLLEIFYPQLLEKVGADWEDKKINIAQEHFSWGFLRTKLLNYFKVTRFDPYRPKVILATPSDELHEGGIIVLAAYLMLHGWNVYYLGASLPVEDLAQASLFIKPNVICLSASRAEVIDRIWSDLDKLPAPVIIGGSYMEEANTILQTEFSNVTRFSGTLSAALEHIETTHQFYLQKSKFGKEL